MLCSGIITLKFLLGLLHKFIWWGSSLKAEWQTQSVLRFPLSSFSMISCPLGDCHQMLKKA